MTRADRAGGESRRPRPKRILLLALHPGYVRNYERTIRQLLEEGHEVHVAFTNRTKQRDDRVAERMANEYLNLSISRAPKSERNSVDNLRHGLRRLADYARYQHPRYADAGALRERAASKLLARRDIQGLLPAVALTMYLPTLGRICHAGYADALSRRALRMANCLPAPVRATRWLRMIAPEVFLATPHVAIGTQDPEFVDAARELRIPSALLIASWDNLTNKGLIKSPTDLVVVWNEAQAAEATELHDVPVERIAITGAQRFDDWFDVSVSSERGAFLERVGLDPGKPYVLYLCSSPFIAPDEVPFVRRLIDALRASGGPLTDAGVLIRPHPQNAEQWSAVDAGEFGNAVIWPRHGEQPVRTASKQGFYDSIHHSLAVVGINTSAQIEAGIVGRTVHTVLDPEFANAHEGTLHFKHLLVDHGGLLYVAADPEELVRNLESVFDGELRDDHAKRFVESFIRPHGLDRPASPLVADAIRQLAEGPQLSSIEVIRPTRSERRLLKLLALLSIPTHPARVAAGMWALMRSIPVGVLSRARDGLDALLRRLQQPGPKPVGKPRADGDEEARLLVVAPWRGDLAGELLYWIPALRRHRRSLRWDTRVIVVVDRADPRWYATLDPEAVIDERDLATAQGGQADIAALLVARGEHVSPTFYGPDRDAEALAAGIRGDSLSWAAFEKATEIRWLFARRERDARHGAVDWSVARPSIGRELLNAAEAGEPVAIASHPPNSDDDAHELLELDVADPIALTTGLEDALALVSTDLGIATLAVSMGVPTTLVRGPGAGHDADLDVLDRVAVSLEVDFEIVEAHALRALMLDDQTAGSR